MTKRRRLRNLGDALAVMILVFSISSKIFANQADKYFLKAGQDWQKIPFFCEEEAQIGIVNPQYREQYFLKKAPFEFRSFSPEWGMAGMGGHSIERTDLFGNREVQQSADHTLSDEEEDSKLGMLANLRFDSDHQTECREIGSVVASCITSRRTIYIVKLDDGTIDYRSFDFKSPDWLVPSTEVHGGHLSWINQASNTFTIQFNKGGFKYRFEQPTALPSPAPSVSVSNHEKKIQTEECQLFFLTNELQQLH
jgi:hypothetical protein